jgi:hypothetical protein
MFLSLLLFINLLQQDSPADTFYYHTVTKTLPTVAVSPFRGEPYNFEVTQPYINLDKRVLFSLDIFNNRNLPTPNFFSFYSILENVTLQSSDFTGNTICPSYILQNRYMSLMPSPTTLSSELYPTYLILKKFDKEIPFTQIRLIRDKEENENIQFLFGRKVTKYGYFNASADYLEEAVGTKRSVGLDGGAKLPFSTSTHLIFYDIKDERVGIPIEQHLLSISLKRKEGRINLFRKKDGGNKTTGINSDIYIPFPYQELTVGFDYPSFDSTKYNILLIDRINPHPLLYIVPRFVIDNDKDYSLSLGTGYHPMVDMFIYGNLLNDKYGTYHSSVGFRFRMEKSNIESFIFWSDELTEENSGITAFYDGELITDAYFTSLIIVKLSGDTHIFFQPLYQKSMKDGKFKPGIFAGIQYKSYQQSSEIIVNSGIILEIIDVSLYFILDDVNDSEKRMYRFGVQWNFYN